MGLIAISFGAFEQDALWLSGPYHAKVACPWRILVDHRRPSRENVTATRPWLRPYARGLGRAAPEVAEMRRRGLAVPRPLPAVTLESHCLRGSASAPGTESQHSLNMHRKRSAALPCGRVSPGLDAGSSPTWALQSGGSASTRKKRVWNCKNEA